LICATLAKQAEIDSLWPLVSDQIVKCIEKTPTFFSAADLWVMCRGGSAFMIIAHQGTDILGATIWRFEDANFVCLMMVGKDAKQWFGAVKETASFVARQGGATRLMASGRLGLFRALKSMIPETKMIRCTVTVEV